ncbi:MAG: hypothetical protein EOQ96_07205 [Mesorhizobium sp.]|nr:MAG: hypothetical protein EOQ96_07205 [Mesorhizobium sp.]
MDPSIRGRPSERGRTPAPQPARGQETPIASSRVIFGTGLGFGPIIGGGIVAAVSTLIVARFLQGLSGGAMLICQLAVLSHEFREGRERAVAWGWWGALSATPQISDVRPKAAMATRKTRLRP